MTCIKFSIRGLSCSFPFIQNSKSSSLISIIWASYYLINFAEYHKLEASVLLLVSKNGILVFAMVGLQGVIEFL